MRVMPGEKLFDLADLSTVWVISDIYEYELSLIKLVRQQQSASVISRAKFFHQLLITYILPSQVIQGQRR